MSDNQDDGDKTEEPTPRRIEQARQKGQVAKSVEVNSFVLLLVMGIMIALFFPFWFRRFFVSLADFFKNMVNVEDSAGGLGTASEELLIHFAEFIALPFLFFVIVVLLAGYSMVGPLLAPKVLEPKLEKLSPVKGFKRIFSVRNLVEFIKQIVKISVVFSVGVAVLYPNLPNLAHSVTKSPFAMLGELQFLVILLLTYLLGILFVVAILDLLYQRYNQTKQLKMSRREVKDEVKQSEGDPHIKARLRQIRRQRMRQRIAEAVPKADVIVTNPTHYAVALQYKPDEMNAPICVAKGQDFLAARIRELADEYGVPIVRDAPLARALYATVELDQEVPPQHYQAVAKVISYIFGLRGEVA